MAKTKFTRYVNPVLESLKELGGSGRPAEVCSLVADKLSLSDEELNEQKASGGSRFENQVAWARFYLAKAGYIDSSRYGVWALTEKSRTVEKFTQQEIQSLVKGVHDSITRSQQGRKTKASPEADISEDSTPPTEQTNYKDQLLEIMLALPPAGFERLCQRILREAGFEQVTVTGRSGDGGIDGNGMVQVNPFVSFKVLFQSKRFSGTVGSPQIRDFRGAMMGRADKGIIITTGNFTADAKREAVRDGVPPIELIDGGDLVDLFEKLEIGLIPRTTYDVDLSFFEQFKS